MSEHRATCPLDCPDACGVRVETDAEGRFAALRGDPLHPWSQGVLCGKTQLYGEVVRGERRVLAPLVREAGRLVETTWERALARVAERVGPLPVGETLALWYGGSMGLVQRRFPLRVMNLLGATLHDGGVCDAAGEAGFQSVLGRCLGPDITRVEASDLLVLWGCDAARTVQHLQPRVQRMQLRGVPVAAIDVWRTDTLRDVERRGGRALVLRPGTDAQLALCLARLAFERGAADRELLRRECLGAEELEEALRGRYGLEETAAITGLPARAIEELHALLASARAPFLKTGIGWTRRRHGAMSMRAVCALAAVHGWPERVHFESYAHFGLAEDVVARPDLRPAGAPREPVSQVGVGRLLEAGRFRAVFVWCHDPAVTLPESARFRRGFARPDLFTVVHEQVLTETAELANVVLPATTFVEHPDVYRSYGHRALQWTRGAARAPGAARSNVDAFAAIARALGLPPAGWDVTAEGLCEELIAASRARFTPDELERLRRGGPVQLHELPRDGWGTPSGRIELASAAAEAAGQPRLPAYVPDEAAAEAGAFTLVCAPSVHTHNSTYGQSARHLRKAGPPRAFLHPDDLARLGLGAGEPATLTNARGAVTLRAEPDRAVPRGLVRVDGLPRAADVPEGVGINALVSADASDLGGGNVLYSTRCDVRRAATLQAPRAGG